MIRHQSDVNVPPSALRAGLGWTEWPARMQRLAPGPLSDLLPQGSDLWRDGGHHPAAARVVADALRELAPDDAPLLRTTDERGVGKECGSPCRPPGLPDP